MLPVDFYNVIMHAFVLQI